MLSMLVNNFICYDFGRLAHVIYVQFIGWLLLIRWWWRLVGILAVDFAFAFRMAEAQLDGGNCFFIIIFKQFVSFGMLVSWFDGGFLLFAWFPDALLKFGHQYVNLLLLKLLFSKLMLLLCYVFLQPIDFLLHLAFAFNLIVNALSYDLDLVVVIEIGFDVCLLFFELTNFIEASSFLQMND